MAILNDTIRNQIRQDFEDESSATWESVGCGLQDIRAAVNAIDQWVSDNQASFNNALPEPAKSNLTAQQKAKLLMFVVSKRYEEDI